MKPSDRDFLFYLEDILTAIDKIEKYLQGITVRTFEEDEMRQDAVLRNLEIIGEAAKHIPEQVKEAYPSIPWSDMYRMRNVVIHHYFGVDMDIIWRVATYHLPMNKADIIAVLTFYKTQEL